MKTEYRKHTWGNIKSGKAVHGIQGLSNGRWLHCCENGRPLLFDTPEERDAKIRELGARP
jgi:hypothetical protein